MSLTGTEKLKQCPAITKIKGNNEDGTVVIGWSKVEGAEKYAIKRSVGDKGEFEHIAWSKKLKFTDDTVEPYTMYHYKITAWKKLEGKKTSTKTSSAKAVIVSDVKVPVNVTVTPDGKGAIVIKWDKVKGAKQYVVLRRNGLCTDLLPVAVTDKCSYRDEDIVSGQPYYYGVQAVVEKDSASVPGKWSRQIAAVALDCGKIISCKSSFGKKVFLFFRIVAGADGYVIERSEKADGEFTEIGRNEGQTAVEFCDKAPAPFRTYYYRVKAYKTVEEKEFVSAPCKAVSVRTK